MSSQRPDPSRFPGYDYLNRVGQAWLSAMSAQTDALNQVWSEMRQGTFDHATMMKLWAQGVQAQFDTLVEASRGPGYVYQPVWLCFDYKAGAPGAKEVPEVLQDTVRIARVETLGTQLETTPFASFDLESIPAKDLYATCMWVGNSRSEIQISLNMDLVRTLSGARQYLSFVLPKGRTAEPPLVIVMLRIQDSR
jgi:hypothetical protein